MPRLAIQDQESSLSFNGTSSKVALAQTAGLPLYSSNTAYTILAWVKLNSYLGVQANTIYADGSTLGTSPVTWLQVNNASSKIAFLIRNGVATTLIDVTGTTVLPRNQWVKVALTDNNGTVKLYINGVEDATSIAGSFNYTRTGTFNMDTATWGARTTNTTSFYFNGLLSNGRLYKSALTLAQTEQAFNGGEPDAANRVGTYSFNEGAGTVAYDSSGNANNGTITNGTWVSDTPTKKRRVVGGNLVYNGDFEYAPPFTAATNTDARWIDGTAAGVAGLSYTITPFKWGVYKAAGTGTCSFDSSQAYSGTYSMKVSATATGTNIAATNIGVENAPGVKLAAIPAQPSTSYVLSGWMKTDYVSGDCANGANIVAVGWTGAGAYDAIAGQTTKIKTSTDWTYYTVTFTTGANVRYLTVKCQINGTGGAATLIADAYFDDITLTPTTPDTRTAITGPFRQPVDNMVRNGNFEYAPAFTAATTSQQKWIDGTAGGSSAGDSPYRWGTLAVTGTASTRYDGTVSRSGSYSLKLSTTAVASAIRVANMNSLTTSEINRLAIPVLPSTSYTLTYWMKTQANSGSATSGARMRITERDGVGGAVITDGTLVTTTTDWTQYTITKTTASTTRFIDVEMFVTGNDGTATLIMDAWFDNIKLDLTSGTVRTAVT